MLVIVVAVVGIAAVLLAKTVQNAQSINKKAQNIATTGTGINTATDSVVQLTRTNELATSILGSAEPLEGQLNGIVSTARKINGLAGSINSTAGAINSTAGAINSSATTINGTAGDINSSAGDINSAAGSINDSANSINSSATAINGRATSINASAATINTSANRIDRSARSINGTARLIDTDVSLINRNIDVSLRLVAAVKTDSGNILGQAGSALDTAACIDKKLANELGNNGDCTGAASTSRDGGLGLLPEGFQSADGFKRLLRDKTELRRQDPDGAGLNLPDFEDPDAGVPDPDTGLADPDAGEPVAPAAPNGQPGGDGQGQGQGNIIERLFPGLRGQAGSGR
ncbi:MAG: hypothetical protein ACR2GL_07825 [Thermoleophilaceae bacterium]